MVNAIKGPGIGLLGSMGTASSPQANAKVFGATLDTLQSSNSQFSLSILENDTFSHCPSTAEVIAFGGIPKPSSGVRSSTRLGCQSNADTPQLERAMKKSQLRDESFGTGQFAIPTFSIVNIANSDIRERADRIGDFLGKSEGEIRKSIKGIKMVEEERILTFF
jgi:hypothetical protein